MNCETLEKLMNEMAKERPVFHSEADFQHELAWRIRDENRNRKIRLEYPFDQNGDRKYLDILVMEGSNRHSIELKYKTKKLEVTIGGERFSLANHSAQDTNRHAAVKDINRMEKFVCDDKQNHTASVLFLTNEDSYWKMPTNPNWKDTMDADFRLHEGSILKGKCVWTGNTKVDPTTITLCGEYTMRWRDYADVTKNGIFRYFCVDVPNSALRF